MNKNKSTIQDRIVLLNEQGEKFIFDENTKITEIFEKIISGYNKIYSIKNEVEKIIQKINEINDFLICKLQGENGLFLLESSKLIDVLNVYKLNNENLKLHLDERKKCDIFKINRKYYTLEGIFLNQKLVTAENLNVLEQLITQILNEFEGIKIETLLVRKINSNKLKVLEVKKIGVDLDFGINIKINENKKIKIKLNRYENENSILLKGLYHLASMIEISFYGDL